MNLYLYIAAFMVEFTGVMLGILISLFMTEKLMASRFEVGFAGFIISFAYTLTTIITAKFLSKKRKYDFIYTPFLIGISFIFLPFLSKPYFMLILFFTGIFYGRFWPSLQNRLRYFNDPKITGNFNISWSMGAILGTFLAGFFYSFGYKFPFIVSSILCCLVSAGFFFFRKTKYELKGQKEEDEQKKFFQKRIVFDIRIANFLSFFVIGALSSLFPRYGLEIKMSPPLISSILTSVIIFRFIFFFLIREKDLLHSDRILFVFSLVILISLILISITKSYFIYLICFGFLGSLNAIVYHNSLIIHLKGGYPTEIHEAIIGAGLFTGPLVCGAIGQLFNLRIAFIALGFIVFFIVVGLNFYRKTMEGK